MTTPSEPATTQLTHLLFGFMTTQAIAVAARLRIADHLAAGPKSAAELAAAAGVHAPSLARLLRTLAASGIFAEEGGRYRLTPLADLLRSDAAESLRAFAIYLGSPWHWDTWREFGRAVATGQPAFEALHGAPFFEWLPAQPEAARTFHDAMTSFSTTASRAVLEAYAFPHQGTLIDVGGGHGLLLTAILERHPQLRGIVYDAPGVVPGAAARIAALGLGDRCSAVAGDFFQSVPAGGDVYLMKHILHDWDDARAAAILGHCERGLRPGGKVLTIEMVLPEGNERSLGKFLDLEMLAFLHSFERTAEQYRALYARAGLRVTRVIATASPYAIVEGVRA